LLKDLVDTGHTLKTARQQALPVVLEQIALGGAALFDGKRTDSEVSQVAPGTPLAHQLPIHPHALATGQLVGVALMAIAEIDAVRVIAGVFPLRQGIVGALQFAGVVEIVLGQDGADGGTLQVQIDPFLHDADLVVVDGSGHGHRQPGLIQQRTVPQIAVHMGHAFEGAGDTAAQGQVFEDDYTVALAIVIPVGVVTGRHWHRHPVAEKMIKLGFQQADIDIIKTTGKIRLETHLLRQTGSLASLVEVQLHAQFGGVAVDVLQLFHGLHHHARVLVLQRTGEPLGGHFILAPGQFAGAGRIGTRDNGR